MKYTIEGFSQKVAKDLGLDALDLIILRWFIEDLEKYANVAF